MLWFNPTDINKTFEMELVTGEKFVATITAIKEDIIDLILEDGRIRKIKEHKIEEVIEIIEQNNSSIQATVQDVILNYLKSYDINLDIKYFCEINNINLSFIKKIDENLYKNIFSLFNKLNYSLKINEVDFKFGRTQVILYELKKIIESYNLQDTSICRVVEPLMIFILKLNNSSYTKFFNEMPFSTNCILYDIDYYKNDNLKITLSLILEFFKINYLKENNLNLWFFLVDNISSNINLNFFENQIKYYEKFSDEIKSIFLKSLKYIIIKLKLDVPEKYKNIDNLSHNQLNDLIDLLFIQISKENKFRQKDIEIKFIQKKINKYLENNLFNDAYGFINKIYNEIDKFYTPNLEKNLLQYKINLQKYSTVLPKDKNRPNYVKAKICQFIYEDLEQAAKYYKDSIENFEPKYVSAIKDYISMYQSIDKQKALKVAEKYKSPKYIQGKEDKISFNNLLINLYEQNQDFLSALQVINHTINQIESKEVWLHKKYKKNMKVYYFKQGTLYLKLEKNYNNAIKAFNNALKFGAEEIICRRNIALCYLGQGKIKEAKKLLEENIKKFADIEATEILKSDVFIKTDEKDEIKQNEIDILINENIDYSTEFTNLDKFINFYLDSCEYIGISATKKQNKSFNESDYKKLLKLDNVKSSIEKAERTLTAVKIAEYLNIDKVEINTKLVESLRFKANFYIQNGRFDIAKNYLLIILNQLENTNKDNFYLLAILIDYIYTILNQSYTDNINKNILIKILKTTIDYNEIKNALINLRLYSKKAFDYLYSILETDKKLIEQYKEKHKIDNIKNSKNLYENIEIDLKTISSKNIDDKMIIEILEKIDKSFLFEVDKSYFDEFSNIFKDFYTIFNSERFEEKELIIERTKNRFEKLLKQIENEPTIFSINNLRDLIKLFLRKLDNYSTKLNKSLLPKIKLLTPLDKYTKINNGFNFHINISNDKYLSPAKNIKIEILYKSKKLKERQINQLSGGDNKTLEIFISNMQEDIFSLKIKIKYTDVLDNIGEIEQEFPISLEDQTKFIKINNPYVPDGDIVKDKKMFFGRDKLIDKLVNVLYNDTVKGIVLYGQKRAGKSTVFYYLQEKIQNKKDKFFVIYFSMGEINNFDSLIRRIVFRIGMDYKKNYGENIFDILGIKKNNIKTLSDFSEFLELLKEYLLEKELELLILIDEFTYLYGAIKDGRYPVDFLKNWKALSQNDLFKSALIGQNSMPMFINEYPNELAVYKKEKISYLDKESAYKLIEKPILLPNGESRYKDNSKELIFEYTNGSPFYIQKICNAIVEHINEKKSTYITTAHVRNVIKMMFENMTLEGDFDNLITIGDGADKEIEKLRKEIIVQIALKSKNIGTASFDDIDVDCNEVLKKEILKTLIETDIIKVLNNRYKISVKLLEYFIQTTYKLGS